jgi:predicted nucleic acid-binding protein
VKIVLNTSPIIFLSKIDSLHLLADCVDDIYAPQAVIEELRDYTPPTFIKARSLSAIGAAYIQGALGQLHQGELEAVVLAQELSTDFVVLDDLLARRKAQRLAINVIGTLGLLLFIEKRGLLTAEHVWQKITLLTQQHGLYLSPKILGQIQIKILGNRSE